MFDSIKDFYYTLKMDLVYKFGLYCWVYKRDCDKAHNRLNRLWGSKKNQKEYEKLTGRKPKRDKKYTNAYKDFIEENKS